MPKYVSNAVRLSLILLLTFSFSFIGCTDNENKPGTELAKLKTEIADKEAAEQIAAYEEFISEYEGTQAAEQAQKALDALKKKAQEKPEGKGNGEPEDEPTGTLEDTLAKVEDKPIAEQIKALTQFAGTLPDGEEKDEANTIITKLKAKSDKDSQAAGDFIEKTEAKIAATLNAYDTSKAAITGAAEASSQAAELASDLQDIRDEYNQFKTDHSENTSLAKIDDKITELDEKIAARESEAEDATVVSDFLKELSENPKEAKGALTEFKSGNPDNSFLSLVDAAIAKQDARIHEGKEEGKEIKKEPSPTTPTVEKPRKPKDPKESAMQEYNGFKKRYDELMSNPDEAGLAKLIDEYDKFFEKYYDKNVFKDSFMTQVDTEKNELEGKFDEIQTPPAPSKIVSQTNKSFDEVFKALIVAGSYSALMSKSADELKTLHEQIDKIYESFGKLTPEGLAEASDPASNIALFVNLYNTMAIDLLTRKMKEVKGGPHPVLTKLYVLKPETAYREFFNGQFFTGRHFKFDNPSFNNVGMSLNDISHVILMGQGLDYFYGPECGITEDNAREEFRTKNGQFIDTLLAFHKESLKLGEGESVDPRVLFLLSCGSPIMPLLTRYPFATQIPTSFPTDQPFWKMRCLPIEAEDIDNNIRCLADAISSYNSTRLVFPTLNAPRMKLTPLYKRYAYAMKKHYGLEEDFDAINAFFQETFGFLDQAPMYFPDYSIEFEYYYPVDLLIIQ